MARPIPWLALIPPLAFVGLAALFLLGLGRDQNTLPSMLVGKPAPVLAIAPIGDPGLSDQMLRTGGPKLVNFWASWCAPCRAEHPTLMALAAEGVPIYGINYKDDPENGARFLAELGDPFAALGADPAGRHAIDWGVYGVPETFLLDADGTVFLRIAGPVTQRVLETQLRPALNALDASAPGRD